jgi:uncharacterized membrane protein YfcA
VLLHALLLLVAGTSAGISATVAGIASIWSYPALLMIGLSPIDANITNSFSLAALGIGSTRSSHQEWQHHKSLIKKLSLATLLGGTAGAFLLLKTPASTFNAIIPYLILLTALMVWLPRKERKLSHRHNVLLWAIALFIGIYAGYFGAGSGLMTIILLMQMMNLDIVSAQAVKNVMIAVGNTVAAIIFIFSGHIHWLATIPLSVGFYIGGHIGPKILRRTNHNLAKFIVSFMGICLSIWIVS